MRAWLVIAIGALGCTAVLGCAAQRESPATDAGHDAAPSFDDCAHCHAAVAADHAASMHAQAFDDALFQREWAARHPPECIGCHAPEAESASDPRVHEGVGCASCHVIDDAITSAEASGRAPHETVADDRFSDPERCARCHEFDFARQHGPPERLQRTLSEWRATGREERCVTCHMPEGSHRTRGPRDADMLARALDVEVHARREQGAVVVRATLRVAGAGHAVPTGDLNRNLVFSAWRGDGERVEAELSRLFARDEDGDAIEIADQRVLPGADRRLALTLPPGRGAVHWSLRWNALPNGTHADAIDEAMRTREIAHGELALER